ncbi:MAG: peptidase S10 [Chlamydiae bacterium]|nr:peptidase S10 [Chlamydiota bacterium]
MLRKTMNRFMQLLLCIVGFTIAPSTYAEVTENICSQAEDFFTSEHVFTLDNSPISYKAIVGSFLIKNETCASKAKMFFTSYTRTDTSEPRPITFCFNGGPGSSAVWLHIGLAGPKRVAFTGEGMPALPYHLEDNTSSLLDVTDLVFIDPISTGFSHAIPPDSAKNFYGVQEDIQSIGDFIQQYLTHFNRWESQKFLMGESYGTTRACALAEYLHSDAFVDVDGIILISAILNFQTINFKLGNDLPYSLFLPSYTAAAWFHHKLSPSLQQLSLEAVLDKARNFAAKDYSQALFQGNQLLGEERASILQELSELTGLSPSYIDNCNLRIPIFCFAKELLREKKRTIGRFDSRIQGIDSFISGGTIEYDPSMDLIAGAFTSTFNFYLRNDLGCTKNAPYKILTDVFPWNYGCDNEYFNVSGDLRSIITKYPGMKVFVASGYYDMATPFFATEYTMQHLELAPCCQSRLFLKNYEGGHMMYTIPATLVQLKKDLRAFYEQAP